MLNFEEPRAWDKIEAALVSSNNSDWKPLTAFVAKGTPDGFVYAGGVLTCDDNAWQNLKGCLSADVDDLLILTKDGDFHMLHVVRVVDCLNLERSQVLRSPFDNSILAVLHHDFNAALLEDVFLFRIPESRSDIFATSAFKKLIEDYNIRNLEFQRPL